MKKTLTVLAVVLLIGLTANLLKAENFVSLNGEFYITLPENWYQVDYKTVDYFLFSGQADQESFQYEAVFADRDAIPFHNGNYLILTLEKIGNQSNKQIDSILTDLDSVFNEGNKYFPVGNLMTDLKTNSPYYDRPNKTITVLADIIENNLIVKKNIWIKKFYEQGIANFYFYCPDSVFEASKPLFNEILNSFYTDNIEDAMPQEKLELADIKNEKESTIGKESAIPVAVIVAVIIVVIIALKKLKNRKNTGAA